MLVLATKMAGSEKVCNILKQYLTSQILCISFFYGADWHDPIHSKDFFVIHQIDKMKYFDEITQKFISNSDLCKIYFYIFL